MTTNGLHASAQLARWQLLAMLALIGLGLATLVAQSLGAAPPAATASQSGSTPAVAPALTTADRRIGSGCWVTGDLVGEANPAEIAAALCGRP